MGRQMDDIAAGAFVLFQLQETATLPVFDELAEGPKAVIGFGEPGLSPLQGLLDHRAPDLVRFTPLGDEGFDGFDDQAPQHLVFWFPEFWGPPSWEACPDSV